MQISAVLIFISLVSYSFQQTNPTGGPGGSQPPNGGSMPPNGGSMPPNGGSMPNGASQPPNGQTTHGGSIPPGGLNSAASNSWNLITLILSFIIFTLLKY